MRGYKVFNPDWTCKGFKYEVGKTYEIDEEPILCKRGFHFCKKLANCFNYYDFDPNNKVAEIETLGQVIEEEYKLCTNKIKIIKELSWNDILELVNTGDYNSGNQNSGHYNSGNQNSGNFNSGNQNSGNHNFGNHNSGSYNSGSYNSGYYNSGYYNSGDFNSGDWNTGDWNTGNCNSGEFNSGNWNTGIFNTETNPKINLFNKVSDWTTEDWLGSKARHILLDKMPIENRQNWWDKELSEKDKKEVMNLPNFDKKIFKDIIGIEVTLND